MGDRAVKLTVIGIIVITILGSIVIVKSIKNRNINNIEANKEVDVELGDDENKEGGGNKTNINSTDKGRKYIELINDDIDGYDKKFEGVELREEYGDVKRDIIPVTPPDSEFDAVISIDDNEDSIIRDTNDNGLIFLYELQRYVSNDLIDSGITLIYSAHKKNEDKIKVDIESTLKMLKISFESLETKNTKIRELFKDDKDLITAWNKCYIQLSKSRDIIMKMENKEDIYKHNSLLDINAIYKQYGKFKNKLIQKLNGFSIYYIEKEIIEDVKNDDSDDVDIEDNIEYNVEDNDKVNRYTGICTI